MTRFQIAFRQLRALDLALLLVLPGAFVVGLVMVYVDPPFAGQDEIFHWQRVIQIARGGFFASTLGDNSWGGRIDKHAYELALWFLVQFQKLQPIDTAESLKVAHALALQPLALDVISFPSTAVWSPLAYLPQAIGVFVGRVFGAEYLGQLYLGRTANLATYLVLAGLAVRIIPIAGVALLAFLVTPHWVHLAGTLSADPINAMVPILLAAWCLRLHADPAARFGTRERWMMGALVVSLGILKPIYFLFCPVILIIPAERFADVRDRLMFIALVVGACLVAAAGWSWAYPFVPGKYWQTGADPAATLRAILADPTAAVWKFYSTIRNWTQMWWLDGYGRFGGHPPPFSFYGTFTSAYAGFFALLALAIVDAAPKRQIWLGLFYAAIALVFFVALLMAFWFGFTAPASPTIDGIQGRYFLVPWVLVMIAIALIAPVRAWLAPLRWPLLAVALSVHLYVAVFAIETFRAMWK